ncbi:MAG: OmpA family protein [Paludibacter sp.]|nr:OmpA family protein [Paludibacter sp.]
MKRTLISLLCVVLPLLAMAQQKDYSHWSVSGDLGVNRFDGDVIQNVTNALPAGDIKLTWGLAVEYAITPIWGVSLDYYNMPFSGTLSDFTYGHFDFKTNSSNFDLNATVNLMKLIFPELKTKWHVNSALGLGTAFYKFKGLKALLPASDNAATYAIVSMDQSKSYRGMTIPVSLSTEYNFTNSFALGVKFQARTYNQDDLEGFKFINDNGGSRKPWRGVSNDMAEAATVYLRYKINAVDKDHLRNITMKEFTDDGELRKLKSDVNGLKGKVNAVEGKVNDLTPRVEKLEKTLSPDGPDDDGDGVPNSRDKEPATPKGNEVDFYGRTVPGLKHITESDLGNVTPSQLVDGKDSDGDGVPDNRDREPNTPKGNPVDFWGVSVKDGKVMGDGSVYFDFDKVDSDAEALRTIQLVAERMKANPTTTVEIRGYADFIGGIPYNQKLSQRRADVVKDKLVKEYGIDASKIIANGKGKLFEPKKAYRLNRRCNFFFNK